MPDILITPGTFNPPATPGQAFGIYVFPKTPVRTLRKWQQFSSAPAPAVVPVEALPVVYSYSDFTSGAITVGVEVATFDAVQPNFAAAGVRYLADATYVKTAHDAIAKTYSAVGSPPFAAGGDSIGVGLVEAEYGGDYAMPSNYFRVLLDFSLTVTGGGDGATYTLTTLDEDAPGATSGTIILAVAYPENPASNGYINQLIDTERTVTVTLLRNGQPFDRIYLLIPITGEVSFTLVPGAYGGDLGIPVVHSGRTWSDVLYGATAATAAVTAPSIPFSGYVRESWASAGTITLSTP